MQISYLQYIKKCYNEVGDKNENIYMVDDIYATGNTAQEIKKVIEELGGRVEGIGVIINIKELNKDEIFSIIEVNEE